jgi:hypothetical protein
VSSDEHDWRKPESGRRWNGCWTCRRCGSTVWTRGYDIPPDPGVKVRKAGDLLTCGELVVREVMGS